MIDINSIKEVVSQNNNAFNLRMACNKCCETCKNSYFGNVNGKDLFCDKEVSYYVNSAWVCNLWEEKPRKVKYSDFNYKIVVQTFYVYGNQYLIFHCIDKATNCVVKTTKSFGESLMFIDDKATELNVICVDKPTDVEMLYPRYDMENFPYIISDQEKCQVGD